MTPRVGLFGIPGVGKSTFICSLTSAIVNNGRVNYTAADVRTDTSSVTKKLGKYCMNLGREGKINFMDTKGAEANLYDQLIVDILRGHIKDNSPLTADVEYRQNERYWKQSPTLDDKMHCVVLVVRDSLINNQRMDILKNIKTVANREGVTVLVALTGLDELEPSLSQETPSESWGDIRSLPGIKAARETAAAKFGLPPTHVHPVFNYHKQSVTNTQADMLNLKFIQHCQDVVEDHLKTLIREDRLPLDQDE